MAPPGLQVAPIAVVPEGFVLEAATPDAAAETVPTGRATVSDVASMELPGARAIWDELRRSPLVSLAYLVAYAAMILWGHSLTTSTGITGWYPVAGLTLAAVTVGGPRFILLTFIAALVTAPLSGPYETPVTFISGAVFAALVYGTAGMILRHNLDRDRPLTRVSDAWWVIGVGVAGAPLASAILNISMLQIMGEAAAPLDMARTFILGDGLGVIALAPLLIVSAVAWQRTGPRSVLPPRDMLSPGGIFAILALMSLTPLIYLNVGGDLRAIAALPLSWLALRFALPGVVIGAFAWSGSSALVLAAGSNGADFDGLQPFLLTGTMLGLIIGAVVSEREGTQQELRHLAMYDQASGLPNEPHLLELLTHALDNSRGNEVTVLLVRFAGLRQVGAALRRADTDQLVLLLQQQVAAIAGPTAQLARPGFDRYAIVMTGIDAARRQQIAEKLVDELSAPLPVDSREVFVDPRVGITVGLPGEPSDVVLAHADHAAEVVAIAEGVRIGYYDASIERAHRDRQELTEDLRVAVERGEFLLAFQPIVTAKEGRVVAAEALLRWVDRKRGPVSPMDFIPVAEETGLILPIGRWVLNEACYRAAQWPHVGGQPIGVSVNVSPIQLLDEGFVGDVMGALERSGLPASRLRMEITEGIELQDIERTISRIQQLRDLGVDTMLDDFGTGHSSLAWVQRLPVSCIKIDRAFIGGIADDGIDRAIVHASLYLSRALGTETVAEGVETEAQREQLIRMGCQRLQGYLFARPQPADVFPDWLNKQRAQSDVPLLAHGLGVAPDPVPRYAA